MLKSNPTTALFRIRKINMPPVTLNPIKKLKDYGLSTRTIAGIAGVNVFAIRHRNWDALPENDPALALLQNAVYLLDDLGKVMSEDDPAAFYEEHLVLMEKNGDMFYCVASRLYEVGVWTRQDFIDYASTTRLYTGYNLAEEFPLTTEVVDASDGHKAIVCRRSIRSLDTRTLSTLDDYTIIK